MGHERHAGIERQQDPIARKRAKPALQRAETPVRGMAAPTPQQTAFDPRLASPEALLFLQRTIGNAAVNQLLRQRAAVSSVSPVQRAVMPAAFFPGLQRHAENEEGAGHICTASCRHAAQRATEGSLALAAPAGATREGHVAHVCGPHCHHAIGHGTGRASVMRATAHAVGKPRLSMRRAAGQPLAVQRHSSFEHKMLGDVSPDDLKVLASAANLNEYGHAVDKNGAAIVGSNGQAIMKQNVVHVLEQEIRRINYFKQKAVHPQGHQHAGQEIKSRQAFQEHLRDLDKKDRIDELSDPINKDKSLRNTDKAVQLAQVVQDVNDSEWQVRIVSLPSEGNTAPLLVTYGEMNTLADIYGSPEEVLKADPKNRYQIMQGIRQQSLLKFLDMLRQVQGANYLKKKFGMHLGQGFDDAIGSTGRFNGPVPVGELRLMGSIPLVKGKKGGDDSQSYKGGLARNACHFAPESWHAWADYHGKARISALRAYALRQAANTTQPGPQKDELEEKADDAENQALIENGFGDHFLQDSYAAGHLINKTEIMRWFVEWLDEHPWQADKEWAHEWRRIQVMAYNQPGLGIEANRYATANVGATGANAIRAKDPQSVENMQDPQNNSVQGRKARFAALGLRMPPSLTPDHPVFNFLVEWQYAAATNNAHRTMTVAKAIAAPLTFATTRAQARDAFRVLVSDGVARVAGTGIKPQVMTGKSAQQMAAMKFVLRNEYVPSNVRLFTALRLNLRSPNAGTKAAAQQQYVNKARNVTYAQYHKFLNSTLLQASTNVLHNHFCKNGIEVMAGNVSLGRIYGDNNMLGKDSAEGVKFSAETALMSRQAIFDLSEFGPGGAPNRPIPTVNAIAARFPDKAKLADGTGTYGSLDQWHTQDLKKLCYDTIFPGTKKVYSLKNIAATFLPKVAPVVSKDAHAGEVF